MKLATKAMFVGLLMCGVLVGWWLSRPGDDSGRSSTGLSSTEPHAVSSDLPGAPISEIKQPFARTPYLGLKDPRWNERKRLRVADPEYQWRTPIEFYGKVIDESNQPVEGAVIDVSWSGTVERYGGDGGGKRRLLSDAAGLFHITGIEGKGMTVYVSKEGYHRRSEPNGWFEYAGFWEPRFIEPDRGRPVVFRLIKRPVAEPTLRVRQRSLPKPPSWQTRIDFLAKPAETPSGGDIVLKITRPSSPGYQQVFDWQLEVAGQGAAEVAESNDEFMLRAPEEGYSRAIVKNYQNARGNSIETVKFYVRNKERRFYAAVFLEITPYYPNHLTKEDTACYIVTATVNPNDSPNVEYDPKKDIRELERK